MYMYNVHIQCSLALLDTTYHIDFRGSENVQWNDRAGSHIDTEEFKYVKVFYRLPTQ